VLDHLAKSCENGVLIGFDQSDLEGRVDHESVTWVVLQRYFIVHDVGACLYEIRAINIKGASRCINHEYLVVQCNVLKSIFREERRDNERAAFSRGRKERQLVIGPLLRRQR
jgi:hypothetical protein